MVHDGVRSVFKLRVNETRVKGTHNNPPQSQCFCAQLEDRYAGKRMGGSALSFEGLPVLL
jgi:hypothetical protein